MGRKRGPVAGDIESQKAWNEMMASNPFTLEEFSITATAYMISRKLEEDQISSGPAAFEFLLMLLHHVAKDELLLHWWNNASMESGEHIRIPIWVFQALVGGWAGYVNGETGFSLEDAFDIGRHQGSKKNTRVAIKLFRRDLSIALQVMNECVRASKSGKPIGLEEAYATVAEDRKLSAQTVKRAFDEFRQSLEGFVKTHKVPIKFQT